MEATGQYWKPIWYLLEEAGLELLLVNARHVKILPGRKTDVCDAAWLAELLEHGLLRGSFVPPAPIRELRDLTRYRKRLIQAHSSEGQRIQKTLEDAGIKRDSVAADVLGASGRAMLTALVAGERDPQVLAELAKGRLRAKLPQLSAQYWRLARRIGKKKAALAVGHSILVIAWHLLADNCTYQDLGGDYFVRRDTDRQRQRAVAQLQALGYRVALEPLAA
jgi:hypothetical protein